MVSALSGRRLSQIGQKAPLLCSFRKFYDVTSRDRPGERAGVDPPKRLFEITVAAGLVLAPELGTTPVSAPRRRAKHPYKGPFLITKGDKQLA